MTDFLLLEQFHKMIKEVPKPRLMFRKGTSARGFFRPYMSMREYTRADVFRSLDEITPVTVRFSSMLGDKGTADTMRNIKGMDVKFRTEEKNYDMICRSLPVVFTDDVQKLPELFEAFSRRESFDGICGRKFWNFVTENPEAINCAMHLFSREGLADSFINIEWYSVNTTVWRNWKNEEFLVRYRWAPVFDADGEESRRPDRNSAEFMAGYDPDRASNDLKRRISRGRFPLYELQVQMKCHREVGREQEADPGKRTLLWDETKYPYMSVGVMKLTGIPEDHRRECELLSFAPGNTIDGIEIHHDAFTDIMDYIYKIDAVERGGIL